MSQNGHTATKTVGEQFVEGMTEAERRRSAAVDSVLPTLQEAAPQADLSGEFHRPHVQTLSDAGLLGLIVPEAYGGMGGGLRDLSAACYAMGTACASTALAYFFHCSSASRGLLALEAIEAGLYTDEEIPVVRAFAEKLLRKMGTEGKWLANFASESEKSAKSAVTITTEATPTDGGWLLNGIKFFGCATGVADEYLVTAKIAGTDTAEGLALFFVPRDAEGVSERGKWDALGMRASATHGIILKDVFIPTDEALTVPGAFVRMMQVSRGSFVGNQLAATAVYLGVAQSVYDFAMDFLMGLTFRDTGELIVKDSSFHHVLIGEMRKDLDEATLWLRRQLDLETSEPPILPKDEVIRTWRFSKGAVAEAAYRVCTNALKACGTRNTGFDGVISRGLRDCAMGLVQAFPSERGKIEGAKMVVAEAQDTFSV